MLQKLHNIFLLLILSIVLIVPVKSADLPDGFPLCWMKEINNENFCPINVNLGHKLFLVDFTSRWEPKQVDWIKGRIFGNTITRNTPPYHKITYIKLEETAPESQKVVYSKCRFKTGNKSKYPGEEFNDDCESETIVKQAYQAWQKTLKKVEKTFFDSHKDAEQSLIIEYIANILREPKFDFAGDYPERKLIIVSDLMQNSDRINLYKFCRSVDKKPDICPSFQDLLKTKVEDNDVEYYLNTIKPKNVENLKVEIIFMNHSYQTKCKLGKTLIPLWVNLFKFWGINIDPVDDITYELDTKDTC